MKDKLLFRIATIILEAYTEGLTPSPDIMLAINGYSTGWQWLEDFGTFPIEVIFTLGNVKILFADGVFTLVMENIFFELTADEARVIIDAFDNGNGETK